MEKTITIDVGRIMRAILKKWWLIAIVGMIAFGTAFIATQNREDVYQGTASVFGASYGSYTESMETYRILLAYGEVATSSRVAQRAAELVGDDRITANQMIEMSKVVYSEESAIIRIHGISNDPVLAQQIANAMAEAFVQEAKVTFGIDSLRILDEAKTSKIVQSRGQLKYSVIAFLAGLLIPMVVIAIRVIVSDEVYYVSDAELDGKLQILGIIPEER